MCKELTPWEKAVEFHGHECPGLAIGVKAVEAAKIKMNTEFSQDEEIVCITENDACGVDAVQVLAGCSIGKGNLIYRGTGKQAFTFFKRKTGEGLRVVLKSFNKEMDRIQRQKYILESDINEIFEFKKPHYGLPEKAQIFTTIICEKCNEGVAEHKIRFQSMQKVCLDCYNEYDRGWEI